MSKKQSEYLSPVSVHVRVDKDLMGCHVAHGLVL